jgi:predicted phage terminase large subunit-like protein
VWRDRPQFWQLEKKVHELRLKWRANLVIVEKAASGIGLIQNIRDRDGAMWLQYRSSAAAKVDRAQQQAYIFEQGRVHLPCEAHWLVGFENELLSFPHGKHDDQVDSTVQFLFSTRSDDLLRRARQFGSI